MCGLVGIVKPTKLSASDVKCFKNMLYADALRGHHSTGVFSLQAATAKVDDLSFLGSVEKEAGTAYNVMKMVGSSVERVVSSRSGLVMGHNRYATMGAHTAKNAHPFEHGDVVLAHNGTLWDHSMLTKDYFQIDSEAICKAMSLVEPEGANDVIKELRGAFTLTWWDYRDNTFNMVRNDERPMFYAISGDGLYYASERLMLEWCMERNGIKRDSVFELPTGKHYKWDIANFSPSAPAITEVDLNTDEDPYLPYYNRGWGSSYSNNYTKTVPAPEAEANELGIHKGDIIQVWMYDYLPYKNSETGRWEGLTQDVSNTTVRCFNSKSDTFDDCVMGHYVKVAGFYYEKGVDGKNYLIITCDNKQYEEEDCIKQLPFPVTSVN